MTTNSLKVLSWNTLESGSGGAWSSGWGCPLEISRKDELLTLNPSFSEDEVRKQLTDERYERIEATIRNDEGDLDLILIQELTADDPWIFPSSLLSETDSKDGNSTENLTEHEELVGEWEILADDKVCNLNTPTIQRIYYRSSTLQFIDSNPLLNSDIPGCLAVFSYSSSGESNDDKDEIFYVANIHAGASATRTPTLRPSAIQNLIVDIETSLSTMEGLSNSTTTYSLPGMICGDWNAHLQTIQECLN